MNEFDMNLNFQFLQNKEISNVLKEVLKLSPKNSELYLIGGSVRNALFHTFFNTYLPQRDFDLVFFGDRKEFENNLLNNSYEEGSSFSKEQKVFLKKLNDNSYLTFDELVLDIHFLEKQDLIKMLEENVNFRFQGTTIKLDYIFEKNWFEKIISINSAIEDIKNKKIVLNKKKVKIHDTTFYAMLRFNSFGFSLPPKEDIELLLIELKNVSKERVKISENKVIGSIGNKEKLNKILKKIDLEGDIFSYEGIQNNKIKIRR
ncbi:MAG: hypothetical protein ACKUBY_03925 [Candidatus Moraniibacteriota bacterium]|jgi:hypothetical protein